RLAHEERLALLRERLVVRVLQERAADLGVRLALADALEVHADEVVGERLGLRPVVDLLAGVLVQARRELLALLREEDLLRDEAVAQLRRRRGGLRGADARVPIGEQATLVDRDCDVGGGGGGRVHGASLFAPKTPRCAPGHAPTWIRTRGLPLRRGTLYPSEL